MHDLAWTTTRQEGPFFELKSYYERSGDRPRRFGSDPVAIVQTDWQGPPVFEIRSPHLER